MVDCCKVLEDRCNLANQAFHQYKFTIIIIRELGAWAPNPKHKSCSFCPCKITGLVLLLLAGTNFSDDIIIAKKNSTRNILVLVYCLVLRRR